MGNSRLIGRLLTSYVLAVFAALGITAAFVGVSPLTPLGNWLVGGLFGAAAAAWIAVRAARSLAETLDRIRLGTHRLAAGDVPQPLPRSDVAEIAALAETIQRLATDQNARTGDLLRQRNEREAVLASMVEGVLAIDADEHVINLNHAGAQLLGLERETALGRSLQEVVRNPALQRLMADVLGNQESASDEIELALPEGEKRILHAQGSVLHDAHDKPIGALVVLHDVTRIRRLETVRRDFVANVSHELKTPVTSIKGFVETLLDGAMNQPGDAERFLRIIASQADRLGAIIEDLLTLSRVEQEEKQIEILLEPGEIRGVLQSAIELCQVKAEEKKVLILLACEDGLWVRMNSVLLEQAVVNLIDNAVKYSLPGHQVVVEAVQTALEVVIRVQDHGCGIPREHLPRIFERFYRVDKARSRALGGTGLGLAIVKHIVQAHGGRTSVKSTVGQGSTFLIHLPSA